MSTSYGWEGIKADMCDAAWCAMYLSASVVAVSTWGTIKVFNLFTSSSRSSSRSDYARFLI